MCSMSLCVYFSIGYKRFLKTGSTKHLLNTDHCNCLLNTYSFPSSSLICTRLIFPLMVLGSSLTNSTMRGYL